MANIKFKGNDITTNGQIPKVGSTAPDFSGVKTDLSETSLYQTKAKYKILNIFPSVDTGVCATSVRQFNQRAAQLTDVTILCISKDLPFAQKRFCGAEGIDSVEMISVFRSDFSKQYGLEMETGPLKGLCSRTVIVVDGSNKVIHAEQVPEITTEPNYEAAIKSVS